MRSIFLNFCLRHTMPCMPFLHCKTVMPTQIRLLLDWFATGGKNFCHDTRLSSYPFILVSQANNVKRIHSKILASICIAPVLVFMVLATCCTLLPDISFWIWSSEMFPSASERCVLDARLYEKLMLETTLR